MEAARRACGGHGYSLLSGLPTLFTHYVQNVTWEGDNNVMLLQVSCHIPSRKLLHTSRGSYPALLALAASVFKLADHALRLPDTGQDWAG